MRPSLTVRGQNSMSQAKKQGRKDQNGGANGADAAEIARFDALADQWWDETGPMAPLHRMNPARMAYVTGVLRGHFGDIANLNIIDVGCGGGLVTEPLARLGARVTGYDGAADLVAAAKAHAKSQQLDIDYRVGTAADAARAGKTAGKTYDAVLALEVIEHVPDGGAFVRACAQLVRPGGLVLLSTINRTPMSFAAAIVGAEYILRWLPRGTHDWRAFVKPSELQAFCVDANLTPMGTTGFVYNPLTGDFRIDPRRVGINYFMNAVRA